MADPLKLLREYALDKKQIRERDGYICFGEVGFPRDVRTNFAIYGKTAEYYTLEALYNFWQKKDMSHMDYVKESVNKYQLVSRPDRNDIIGYLSDRNAKPPPSVDVTAAVPVPVQMGRHVDTSSDSGPSAKRMRSDDDGRLVTDQEQMGALLNESLGSPSKAKAHRRSDEHKRHARAAGRRSAEEGGGAEGAEPLDTSATAPGSAEREFRYKERTHRNRATCMNATRKNFQQSIFPVLKQLKERENAQSRLADQPHEADVSVSSAGGALSAKQVPGSGGGRGAPNAANQAYSRYDQERFQKQRDEFDVDPSATFAGKDGAMMSRLREGGGPAGSLVRPAGGSSSGGTPATPATPNTVEHNAAAAGSKRKRPSRTPIIVVPASGSALISMLNAKDILQDYRFVGNEQKKAEGAKRESEILVQRKKADGSTVPFRVLDNATRLSNDEFERIVAVFVQGPAWQFKNWRPKSDPVDVFQRHCPFYLCHEEMPVDGNVAKWAVNVLKVSKLKRHLDRAVIMQFWSILDKFIMKNYPQLRF